jgi:hypothetical protein
MWPVASRSEELPEPTSGLVVPGESIGAAKAGRKPGPRWQNRDTGGGLPPNSGSRKRPLGSTWRWKAFWVEQVVSLDGDAMEAVLGAPSEARSTDQVEIGVRQRASEVVRQRRTRSITPRRGGIARAKLWARLPSGNGRGKGHSGRNEPKLEPCAVKRTPPGAGSSQDGLAPQSPTGSRSAVAVVGEAKAPRSGITRSTGARVVSRLQKSARSIFLTRSRGAERQTERARGSTSRRFLP